MNIIWDIPLVILSVATAIIGSITALTHSQRMRSSTGRAKKIWMVVGGLTLGMAVWAMHFVGMSAFHLAIPIGYELDLTLFSIIPGIASALLCFYVISKKEISSNHIIISSVLMGAGIATMHYVGMAAIKMSPPITYETTYVILSILVAIIASLGSLLMMYKGDNIKLPPLVRLLLGGIVMGIAISGMHYVSMFGIQISPDSICTSAKTGIGQYTPVKLVFVVVIIIFTGGILAASFDQRITRKTVEALDGLKKAHRELRQKSSQLAEQESLLRSITDAANDAVILLDSKGTVAYWNAAAETIFGYREQEIIGENLHDIVVPDRYLGAHKMGFEKFIKTGDGDLIGTTRRLEAIRMNGEEFPVDISLSSVKLHDEWFAVGIVRDATKQVELEELIKKEHEHLAAAQRLAHIGSWEWNIQENSIHWSDEIYRIFGLRPQEFAATYDGFINTVYKDDRDNVRDAVNRALEGGEYSIQHRIVRPDGEVRVVYEQGSVQCNDEGIPLYMIGTVHDITDIYKKEAELRLQSKVLNDISDSIFVHRPDGTFIYLNEAAYKSRGYQHDELINKRVQDLDYHDSMVGGDVYKENIEKIQQQMQEKGEASFEVSHITKQGNVIPLEVRSRLINDNDEPIIISITRDISERLEMLSELKKLASTDKLTGIYNRHYFETILIRELDRSNRYGVPLVIIMFDIDHFKNINDTYGHDIGDAVLTKLTSIVKNEIRESDYFVRWGGEEFIILCPEIGTEQGRVVAEKLRLVISETTFEKVDKITASFGVTSYKNSEYSESFLKRVDELLYRAKESGRNQVAIDVE